MVNSSVLDRAFAAYSHPLRREILERLTAGELTVGEATGDLPVSGPAISRHLKVLEEAGTIVRVIDGRHHRLRLREGSSDAPRSWLERQRALWERKFDVVEEYLSEQREEEQR
ncbi:MAG: ArsR/SmtB family transcription factor [Thermoleophilaceae bacterium]